MDFGPFAFPDHRTSFEEEALLAQGGEPRKRLVRDSELMAFGGFHEPMTSIR